MANRVAAFSTFAGIAPAWSLPNLDANFAAITASLNDSSLGYMNGVLVDSGSVNNYVLSTIPYGTPSAYNEGMLIAFIPSVSNNSASTVTVGALSSIALLNQSGGALVGGEVLAGRMVTAVYHGGSGFWLTGTIFTSGFFLPAANPGNVTFNCIGLSSVGVVIVYSATSPTTSLALHNVSPGTVVNVVFLNTTGSNLGYAVSCTDSGGNNFTTTSVITATSSTGGTRFVFQSGASVTPGTINGGASISMIGVVIGPVGAEQLQFNG